jgi:hypothetical protein
LRKRIKGIRACFLLFLASTGYYAFGQSQPPFVRYYPNASHDFFIQEVLPLENGDIILSGQAGIWYPSSLNMRVDASGNTLWTTAGGSIGIEYKWRTQQVGDSLFFEAGMSTVNQQAMTNPFIRCYDSNGFIRWRQEYDTYPFDQFTNLVSSPDGKLYAFGVFQDSNGLNQAMLLHLDLNGDIIWRREFRGNTNIAPSGIAIGNDGSVYFSTVHDQVPHFRSMDSLGNEHLDLEYPSYLGKDPFSEMLLTTNGNFLCFGLDSTVREFTPAGSLVSSFLELGNLQEVLPAADGGAFTVGTVADGSDFYLRKRDSNWNELWYRSFILTRTNSVQGLAELSTGNLLLGGMNGTSVFDSIVGLLIRTDCEGRIEPGSACGSTTDTLSEFQVFPNPSNGMPVILIPTLSAPLSHEVWLFNNLGKLVFQSTNPAASEIPLDLHNLSDGIYHLRLNAGKKEVWTTKIILHH